MKEHLESDLNTAGFLLARGFRFLGLEKVGSRYAFQFNDSAGNAAEVARDFAGGGLIAAREFAAAVQQLKAALYEAKFAGGRNGNENARQSLR